jgi:uncharacterized membrane protein YhaH (DUF805 family)
MNDSTRTLFFSFAGRINRATYWTRAFPVFLVFGFFVVAASFLEIRANGTQGVVSIALSLGGLWPILAVTIKRLHDRGRSAWFLVVFLIPVLGPIWLLVEIWTLPGDRGSNRFGDAPQDTGARRQWLVPLFDVVGFAALLLLLVLTFALTRSPGTALTRALRANGYELTRTEAPVSGLLPLPAGNSLTLMHVDGTAKIGSVEISQCRADDHILPGAQVCQLDGFANDGTVNVLIGTPKRTPAFSVETAEGRHVVILSVDFLGHDDQNADVKWLLKELNRP